MTRYRRGKTLTGAALVILTAASACRAQAPLAVEPYPRHAVFRPTFEIPTRRPLIESGFEYPTKPIFLRGYSGYNYGRGPRGAFIETGYGTGHVQAVGAGQPLPADRHHHLLGGGRWLQRGH